MVNSHRSGCLKTISCGYETQTSKNKVSISNTFSKDARKEACFAFSCCCWRGRFYCLFLYNEPSFYLSPKLPVLHSGLHTGQTISCNNFTLRPVLIIAAMTFSIEGNIHKFFAHFFFLGTLFNQL